MFFKRITQFYIRRTVGNLGAHVVLYSSWADSKNKLVKIKRERQIVLINKLRWFFFYATLFVYPLGRISSMSLLESV